MSGTSSPSSPLPTSRTIAIIKGHALEHRFDIESRISSAGFEIIKERQMGFMPDDPNVEALFGDEAASLSGEPVWVYVLERRRAVEVWISLMGHADPHVARGNSPDSLRALFGSNPQQNAVYGSPDGSSAELQISSLFASSPPFPPVDQGHHYDQEDVPTLEDLGGGTIRVDVKSKTAAFKARPVPSTNAVPSIKPRMSRAAALRAGMDVPTMRSRPSATRESIANTFANVPGHKRATSIAVASTAPPTIAPRQTRASLIRSGQEAPSDGLLRKSVARAPNTQERTKEIFANVPGHKRRETISVASTAPPNLAPRPTRASALRTGEPSPPRPKPTPSKSMDTFKGVPGHKRAITVDVASTKTPITPPKTNRSALLRQQKQDQTPPPSSFRASTQSKNKPLPPSRAASQTSVRPSTTAGSVSGRSENRSASVELGRTGRTSTASTPRAPSITPRTNKSAALRAKNMTPKPVSKATMAF